jgi:Zn-dependent oligopeptidase
LTDAWRAKSLSPSNPILDAFHQRQQQQQQRHDDDDDDADSNSSSSNEKSGGGVACDPLLDSNRVPDFSKMQPHHLVQAAETVKSDFPEACCVVEDLARNVPEAIDRVLQSLSDVEEPIYAVKQIACVMEILGGGMRDDRGWQLAAAKAASLMESCRAEDSVSLLMRDLLLEWQQKTDELAGDDAAEEIRWTLSHLLKRYRDRHGDIMGTKDEASEKFRELSAALKDAERSLLERPSDGSPVRATRGLVADMYRYLGLSGGGARLLGHESVAERVLAENGRAANPEEIRRLHRETAGRLVPSLRRRAEETFTFLSGEMNSTTATATTATSSSRETAQRKGGQDDDQVMQPLQMEHHVTLAGALRFAFRVCQDFLGIAVVQVVDHELGWNKDVMLFHVLDTTDSDAHLGSFFLDPFARDGKLDRPVTVPIFVRGATRRRQPVVCLSLTVEPPPWDTDPVRVTWSDVESLLHELGHVCQFLLAKSTAGAFAGAQNMPVDVSEFLPKFMEHWLWEPSTIHTLALQSETEFLIPDGAVDAAYKVRSEQKRLELAQQTFYGALELELFSTFDLRGSESLLSLQERLAAELIPHDQPDRKDATALLNVFREAASGRPVGWYRYLWCDALAAACFERCKEAYTNDPESMKQLSTDFRRLLLEPGAAVDFHRFRSHFGLEACSPDTLLQRYRL